MKLLGIDHGLKRIGLAVSDSSGMIARELTIIHRKTNREDFQRIIHIAHEQQAAAIVVGLPINSDALPGEYTQADTVRNWVGRLQQVTDLPVVLWDEQLTSQEAQEISIRQGRKARDRIDDLAARIILQSYLNAVHDGLASLPQVNPHPPTGHTE